VQTSWAGGLLNGGRGSRFRSAGGIGDEEGHRAVRELSERVVYVGRWVFVIVCSLAFAAGTSCMGFVPRMYSTVFLALEKQGPARDSGDALDIVAAGTWLAEVDSLRGQVQEVCSIRHRGGEGGARRGAMETKSDCPE
jgi:hypothetical protein